MKPLYVATNSTAADLKLIITMLAIAGTLTGWSIIAHQAQPVAGGSAAPDSVQVAVANLPAVATVVPLGQPRQNATSVQMQRSAASPPLRRANTPPAAITTTRSSR